MAISEALAPKQAAPGSSPPAAAAGARRRRQVNWLLWIGGAIMALVLLSAVLGPLVVTQSPTAQSTALRTLAPGAGHPFGTDRLGRDVLARTVHGARVTLLTGGVVALVGLAGGLVLGAVAGYYGGLVDAVAMRIVDVFMSFPGILVAIGIMAVLGQGTGNIILALSIIQIPRVTRVVRGAVIQVRERDYVQAARAVGTPDWLVMARHVLPNCLGPVSVQASLSFVEAVRTEATLSFLGLGTPPPAPSWGNMLDDSRMFLQTAPWMMAFPALALAVTILGMNLLGDGLRDLLDPRLRRSG